MIFSVPTQVETFMKNTLYTELHLCYNVLHDCEKEIFMSILNVEHVTHGFGARQILNDASFRLLKGEHVGLVGANGEGKSTFLNIIMGKLQPDEER